MLRIEKKRGQIALEFLLLMAVSIMIVLVLIAAIAMISKAKANEKTYYELNDLGKSLQQEIILASEMEEGYIRLINLPETIYGRNYNISVGNISQYTGHITFTFEKQVIYFHIPLTQGTFAKGNNTIKVINKTIIITNN